MAYPVPINFGYTSGAERYNIEFQEDKIHPAAFVILWMPQQDCMANSTTTNVIEQRLSPPRQAHCAQWTLGAVGLIVERRHLTPLQSVFLTKKNSTPGPRIGPIPAIGADTLGYWVDLTQLDFDQARGNCPDPVKPKHEVPVYSLLTSISVQGGQSPT
jgi:hypothetical protein